MAEHVGVRNFSVSLRQVSGLLEGRRLFFLQIVALRRPPEALVVRNDRGATGTRRLHLGDVQSKYIFRERTPASRSPSSPCSFEKAGFEIRASRTSTCTTAMTILRWYRNWERNREKVIAAYGERWYRLWHLFLAWSVFTGEQGRGDCMQIVAHKSRPSFDSRALRR